MTSLEYIYVDYPEPHKQRQKEILASHPEIRGLQGHNPITAIYSLVIAGVQIAAAILLRDLPFWKLLGIAYIGGALANHALFVIIHECSHNLVFKSARANKLMAIFTNLPIGFPMALSFRKYHLLHHLHQGNREFDADLPSRPEGKFIARSGFLKMSWLFFFPLIEPIRAGFLKRVNLFDSWTFGNMGVQVAFVSVLIYFFGWMPIVYLLLSSLFSVGLHPLGARWIQEHFVVWPNQETYSYYGPLNRLAFNVGYHNEHHDFMYVSWVNLPKIRKMAPEFYDGLHFHTSWTGLLIDFVKKPDIHLFSRVVRTPDATL